MKRRPFPFTGTVYLLLFFPFFLQDGCPDTGPTSPDTVYVDAVKGNDSTGQRGNKDKPFNTIQMGINRVRAEGDTVLVMEGTYYGDIDLGSKSITVKSESGPNKTIIYGSGSGSAVAIKGDSSIFQGFTVMGSESTFGGFFVNSMDTTIRNNIITGNGYGIGISLSSNSLIVNNLIHNNNH